MSICSRTAGLAPRVGVASLLSAGRRSARDKTVSDLACFEVSGRAVHSRAQTHHGDSQKSETTPSWSAHRSSVHTPLSVPQNALSHSWHTVAVVEKMSSTPIRPMTIKRLLQLEPANDASLLRGAEWIREELPVRLSHRLYDFHRLPFVAVTNPLVHSVYETYLKTFDRMRRLPPLKTVADMNAFVQLVEKERSTHDRTVDLMGQGVRQLRRICRDVDLNSFLERFFYFRIGRRVMIDQLVHLQSKQEGWQGIIHLNCHAAKIIEQRSKDVRESCRHSYGLAPRVVISGNTDMKFATIPDHLALIVTEVLKNALRATVEFHTMGNSLVDATTRGLIQEDEDLPEVKVEVYKGKREVVIKISDKGGGVPPPKLQDIWSFGYSTVGDSNTKMQENSSGLGENFIRSDMAGYGFGLPLARAFARYFGGDIHVQSHFGIGTDVYITLNHIGDKEEALYYEERPELRLEHKAPG
ncbi:ATPase/histidine kinase/DNA gyrase B/HSP90 domain-containing protein [Toxoplasma gondii RUB]|uniref:Protein-serine/threonine kinase n=8 Tax=Toxoplasma gondii TaxID=5811 RepID=V4YN72_TOXGV|nr:ATPase/histidine kinase/DNA gyrase B/HSP90 domain-containing protein [Toxoplasma gondii VEG]KFG31051.1 ATPase/histidine kinase/DNA gyrase B/HSP90 domain-containing protein [Toxoplasma gondii GAB2-2007-GAL-DOM2]KFG36215.1 ATPase/histidine kinase/DNA gyrase B/HSP90 domain-containing protein [Toxoplasma gondii FOU]KFG43567.1 ATPase/histidine kinase/DNA gyrase B/HSP90 domain-containing protein [Toxoplasma gondii p89]KFG57114.1 ATPase/histidine kinase/DNA gyrase B/HSP90 domain-containing protein 